MLPDQTTIERVQTLRAKVLNGSEITTEELKEMISYLRETRGKAAEPKPVKERATKAKKQSDADDMLAELGL